MSGPWEKYQAAPAAPAEGPWAKYAAPAAQDPPMSVMGAPGGVPPAGPDQNAQVPARKLPPADAAMAWLKRQGQGLGNAGLVLAEGLAAPGMALTQLAQKGANAVGLTSDEQLQAYEQQMATQQGMMAQDRKKVWGGEAVHGIGQALATAPVMLIPGGAPAGAGLATRAGYGAAQGALTGAASRFLTPESAPPAHTTLSDLVTGGEPSGAGESFGDFLSRKSSGALGAGALGGTFGGAVPLAVAGGSKVASKGADLLAGTKLGRILGITQELNPKYAGAPELSAKLDRAGITAHTVGDITGDPAIVAQEAALVRNNPAMMERRLLENTQASDYAQKVVDDLKATVDQTGWKKLADVERAAAEPGKRQGSAQQLLTAIQNSGDDWKEIAQQSGNLKLFVNKLRADQMYDKAESIARLYGPVKTDNLTGSLKASIGAMQRNTAADQSAVPYLQRILDGIEGGSQKTGFGDLREMRTALNNKLQELLDPKSVIQGSSDARPYLQNTIAALERDLDKFAKGHSSGMRNAWRDATAFYRDQVVPYKEAAFGRALADTDPLKAANLFKSQNPSQQARFFELLEPKGQAAVRSGLIEDAISAGEKTQRGVMGQSFSLAQAAGKLEQLQRNGAMGVAFKGGEDTWSASGLAKLLRTVDRSDNVAFIPKTGMTAEMIGAKAEGNTTILGAVAKAYDWFNRDHLFKLYTDPKGKALLQRASGLTPGSPAMWDLINNQIPKLTGAAAAQATTQQPK